MDSSESKADENVQTQMGRKPQLTVPSLWVKDGECLFKAKMNLGVGEKARLTGHTESCAHMTQILCSQNCTHLIT